MKTTYYKVFGFIDDECVFQSLTTDVNRLPELKEELIQAGCTSGQVLEVVVDDPTMVEQKESSNGIVSITITPDHVPGSPSQSSASP
jgi:hypothetical protein